MHKQCKVTFGLKYIKHCPVIVIAYGTLTRREDTCLLFTIVQDHLSAQMRHNLAMPNTHLKILGEKIYSKKAE